MKKSNVNGDDTNQVYKWLKSQKGGLLGLTRIKVCFSPVKRWPTNFMSVQWNFEKFLVDKNGNVVQRWGSSTTPETIGAYIAEVI